MPVLVTTLLLIGCSTEPTLPGPARSITADALRADVEALASDAMNGREALTPGREAAGRWLVDALAPLGLRPLPDQVALEVPFPLYRQGWDVTHSEIVVGDERFVPVRDFAPLSLSGAGALDAPVVFAGYGITAEEHGWDDYAGLDVGGRWVFLLRHEPGEEDEDSPFDGKFQSRYATFATKAKTAQQHGAAGMLLVTDPLHHTGPEDLRPPEALSVEPWREASDEDAFLAIHVGRAVADTLVAASGHHLEALQQAVDEGTPPADLALGDVTARVALPAAGPSEEVFGHNVFAVLPGSDRAGEWVVVGAHYDHQGGFPGDGHTDTIYNGADDNASGSATVLALARALAAREQPPRRTVVFAWFDAEEKGLLGSRAALLHRQLPADRVVAMLNFDMVGRNPEEPVEIQGEAFATGAREVLAAAAVPTGLRLRAIDVEYHANSDYASFCELGIPFLGFFTGTHEDYHQPGDEADKLDYAHMEQIGRAGYVVLEALADARWTPDFRREIDWLGATVRVEARGAGRAAVLEEVAVPGRAYDAGLRDGDVLLAVGARRLRDDPGSAAEALASVMAGAIVTVDADRDGQAIAVVVDHPRPGFLGVRPAAVDAATRAALALPSDRGVLVESLVEDGPAARAGLREGDVLVAIDGVAVRHGSLHSRLERIGAGETARVELIREGERLAVPVVLGERPARHRGPPPRSWAAPAPAP